MGLSEKELGSVGARIKQVRIVAGLGQQAFARSVGLKSQNHLSRIETGERGPSLKFLINLNKAYDIPIDYILRGEAIEGSSSNQYIRESINLSTVFYARNLESLQEIMRLLVENINATQQAMDDKKELDERENLSKPVRLRKII